MRTNLKRLLHCPGQVKQPDHVSFSLTHLMASPFVLTSFLRGNRSHGSCPLQSPSNPVEARGLSGMMGTAFFSIQLWKSMDDPQELYSTLYVLGSIEEAENHLDPNNPLLLENHPPAQEKCLPSQPAGVFVVAAEWPWPKRERLRP